MKNGRFSDAQIMAVLKQAEAERQSLNYAASMA